MIERFLRDESGAMTVEWVVLTAAMVGLALATMSMIAPGAEDLTGDTVGEMDGEVLLEPPFGRP